MAPVNRSEIRPRRAWYWVAGMVALLTVVGSVLIFTGGDEDLGSLTDVFGTLEELEVPGEVTVDLDAGAEWAIYRGAESNSEGAYFNGSSLECQVRDPDGDLIPLSDDFGFTNVTLNGEVFVTEYTFDAPEAGSYAVGCRGRGPAPGETVLVGQQVEIGEIFGFFGRFAAGIAILLLGLLATTAIALPVMLTRSKRIGEARRAGALRG